MNDHPFRKCLLRKTEEKTRKLGGTSGGTRTHTLVKEADFESAVKIHFTEEIEALNWKLTQNSPTSAEEVPSVTIFFVIIINFASESVRVES